MSHLQEPAFEIEEIVYHKVTGQKGMVVSILYHKRYIVYGVCWGPNFTDWTYDFEISKDPIYDTMYNSTT